MHWLDPLCLAVSCFSQAHCSAWNAYPQPPVTPVLPLVSVLMSLPQRNCVQSPRLYMPPGTTCLSSGSFAMVCNMFILGIICMFPVFSPWTTSSIKGRFYLFFCPPLYPWCRRGARTLSVLTKCLLSTVIFLLSSEWLHRYKAIHSSHPKCLLVFWIRRDSFGSKWSGCLSYFQIRIYNL